MGFTRLVLAFSVALLKLDPAFFDVHQVPKKLEGSLVLYSLRMRYFLFSSKIMFAIFAMVD